MSSVPTNLQFPFPFAAETSNLSSISSKTSSVKRSDSSIATHYYSTIDNGKTMDLFDSTTSLAGDKCNESNGGDYAKQTNSFTACLNREGEWLNREGEWLNREGEWLNREGEWLNREGE